MRKIKCTISGSFRKFLPEINSKIEECRESGIDVLSPALSKFRDEKEGFVYLNSDSDDANKLESKHLSAITNSDFLYVVNPSGYIGTSVTFEIGYALAHYVPIYCLEKPSEHILSLSINGIEPSIQNIKEYFLINVLLELPKGANLITIQSHVRKMVNICNFDEETMRDVLLLLVEEIGELAKVVRKEIGLKYKEETLSKSKNMKDELADCLIYLLDIANLANIDLEDAIRSKLEKNITQSWKSVRS